MRGKHTKIVKLPSRACPGVPIFNDWTLTENEYGKGCPLGHPKRSRGKELGEMSTISRRRGPKGVGPMNSRCSNILSGAVSRVVRQQDGSSPVPLSQCGSLARDISRHAFFSFALVTRYPHQGLLATSSCEHLAMHLRMQSEAMPWI